MSDLKPRKLPMNVRILIGIAALPSVALAAMLLSALSAGDTEGMGVLEWVYALVGIGALYMALTGKRWF